MDNLTAILDVETTDIMRPKHRPKSKSLREWFDNHCDDIPDAEDLQSILEQLENEA